MSKNIDSIISEILHLYFLKTYNGGITTKEATSRIKALIVLEEIPLVKALHKICYDFIPENGQEQLALSEIRECASIALREV
jgi:hypothetical protein